jgi:predicted nucleotidyltransferase
MNLARPYSSASPSLEGDVLAVLAGTTRALTGREVARLARRGSQRGVLSALERLVDQGLVFRTDAGHSQLHTLNRDHLAAPAVELLVGMRGELLTRLGQFVNDWEIAPIHVSLFGSAARGDGGPDSDVDLLVIRPDGVPAEDLRWSAQLDQLADSVRRWTGNPAAIAELSMDDLRGLRERRPRVAKELEADAIALLGPDASALLSAA